MTIIKRTNWNNFLRNSRDDLVNRKVDSNNSYQHNLYKTDMLEKISFIKDHPEYYLQRDKKNRGYICPLCGSGTGMHGTGMSEGKGHFKGYFCCWSCKDIWHDDLIEIIRKVENINTRKEAFKRTLQIFGID